jgi:Protein of unknown function DUF72
VEVNYTFYRLPPRSAVPNWVEQTPPDFLFTVKASRFGRVIVAAFHDREVQQVLGLPPDICPLEIIPIGYCADGPRRLADRAKARIVHNDRYGSK